MMALAAFSIAFTGLVAVQPTPAQASVIGDNYPSYLANAAQDALVDPWRFYNRECTSFVAWRLNSTNGVPFTNQYLGADLWWGNANTWGTSARAKGVLVDKIPAVGSVAWSTAGKYGHVAWVAEVLDNGKIVVEEYNWGTVNGEKGRYRYRTALASSFTGFIHIKDLKSWPPSDGSFVRVQESGEIYRIVGGAPVYVSSWAPFGGSQYTQDVSQAKFNTLPKVPKNGTYIRGQSSGDVYTIAHGAPIHVASWAGVGGEKPTIGVDDAAIDNAGGSGVWRFLRARPSDGFIRGATSYRIYHVVNGRPYYVSSWAPFGGEKPYVTVDDTSINSCNHLNCDPWGAFDSVSGGKGTLTVAGWAQDPNTTNPVNLHVYVDGVMAGSTTTNRARADIEAKYHRGLSYGYKATFTASPGKHDVCVYAINVGAGTNNTHIGCKSVTVAPLSAFTTKPTPTISGVLRVNETLTAHPGTWKPSGAAVGLQWKANGTAIAGATGAKLKLTGDLAGKKITVVATATLAGYTPTSKTSASTGTIAALSAFTAAPTPTISGSTRVGSKLTANLGVWKPSATTVTITWLRDGKAISGAASGSYVLAAGDMGKSISVTVTSATRGYAPTSRTSVATAPITGLSFTAAPAPTITGTAAIGQTVIAQTGGWSPSDAQFSYQWKRNGVAIAGATQRKYVATTADLGASLSVTVTATKAGYTSTSTSSAGTAKVPALRFSATTKPTISGTVMVGRTLTAAVTAWTPAATGVTYKWKRDGVVIDGATGTSYVLTPADLGSSVTVVATGTRNGYTSVGHLSVPTAKVVASNLTYAQVPTISGTAKVGQTLTAQSAAWKPAPVTFGYQWNRNGSPIPNATKATYVLTGADKGAAVTVTLTGSKQGYNPSTKTSAVVTPK